MKHGMSIIIAAAASFLLALSCGSEVQQQKPQPDGVDGGGILVIAYAPDSADTFMPVGQDSIIVLEWLRQSCDSAKVTLGLKNFPFGILVDAIGPRRNGDGGNWLYKVNGKMVPKAASTHVVSCRDTVDFFYH